MLEGNALVLQNRTKTVNEITAEIIRAYNASLQTDTVPTDHLQEYKDIERILSNSQDERRAEYVRTYNLLDREFDQVHRFFSPWRVPAGLLEKDIWIIVDFMDRRDSLPVVQSSNPFNLFELTIGYATADMFIRIRQVVEEQIEKEGATPH